MFSPTEVADVILGMIRDDTMCGQAIAMMYGQPPTAVPPALRFG
jgi:hypothetical protein